MIGRTKTVRVLALVAVMIIDTVLSVANAEQNPKTDCADLTTRYYKARAALPLFRSVASEIVRRRMEEQYCLELAQCMSPDRAMLGSLFVGCLRDVEFDNSQPVTR